MKALWVRMVILEKRGTDKIMNSHKMRGKNEKFLKTALKITFIVQNTCFSRLEWVANKSPKTHVTNFKNLSKYFSWLEGLLASKLRSILSKLTTRASTLEPVAKLSHENAKNPDFLKFFQSLFRNRELDSPKSRKSFWVSSWLGSHDWLDLRGRVAKIEMHNFWKFWKFSKQKNFPKTIKTLKNIFVFDQHMFE